ncbi:O-methyltransferase [Streptomyces humi]|uniref:O-methyltransferase n=1 Tax=Streptomyces humi TaxID=1428620 RepID=UPI0006289596|nr:O-methyltransferase [Streptomyces humi]
MTTLSNGFTRALLGPRDPVLDAILHRSLAAAGLPTIQVDDNTGRLLRLLTELHRPRHVIEIGTLFGYSTVHIARGLPPGGTVTTLEVDPEAARVAAENFALAGVADRVTVVVGDAVDHLATVAPESVGMLFIDADKKSYPRYLAHGFPLLEPGGLLVADDVLALGDYGAESPDQPTDAREVAALTAYTRAVGRSPRLLSAFAGTENGLLISRKERR